MKEIVEGFLWYDDNFSSCDVVGEVVIIVDGGSRVEEVWNFILYIKGIWEVFEVRL